MRFKWVVMGSFPCCGGKLYEIHIHNRYSCLFKKHRISSNSMSSNHSWRCSTTDAFRAMSFAYNPHISDHQHCGVNMVIDHSTKLLTSDIWNIKHYHSSISLCRHITNVLFRGERCLCVPWIQEINYKPMCVVRIGTESVTKMTSVYAVDWSREFHLKSLFRGRYLRN